MVWLLKCCRIWDISHWLKSIKSINEVMKSWLGWKLYIVIVIYVKEKHIIEFIVKFAPKLTTLSFVELKARKFLSCIVNWGLEAWIGKYYNSVAIKYTAWTMDREVLQFCSNTIYSLKHG